MHMHIRVSRVERIHRERENSADDECGDAEKQSSITRMPHHTHTSLLVSWSVFVLRVDVCGCLLICLYQ